MTIPRHLYAPKHWPTWLAVLAMWLISRLPQPVCYRLGAAMGRGFHLLARRRKHICQVNLRLCFPTLGPAEQRRLVAKTMRDQGIGLLETLRIWFLPPEKLGVQLDLKNEHLMEIGEDGRGILVVGSHFTCLDICGLLVGLRFPADSFYRVHKNPVLEWVWSRSRGRFGQPIHRRDMKRALRRLREGHRLFYLPDQDYGRKSAAFVDFFGVTAATTLGTSTLAKGGRARVIFPTFRRCDNGRRFEVSFRELEDFPSDDPAADARRINALLEQAILPAPEQYMWVHRRFKTRPEGERGVY